MNLVADGRVLDMVLGGAFEDHTTRLDLGREPTLDDDRLSFVGDGRRLLDDDLTRWWRHFRRQDLDDLATDRQRHLGRRFTDYQRLFLLDMWRWFADHNWRRWRWDYWRLFE